MRFLNINKKKNFLVFFFAFFVVGGVFGTASFVDQESGRVLASRHGVPVNSNTVSTVTTPTNGESGGFWDSVAGALAIPFKALIYAVFVVFGWMASAGLTLFEWVIKPENISGPRGLLNQDAIYELWQFVRDFFNIFFIFVLLYIAFTTVFQIQKNFKKAILSLVLAALFVNFSYPITRVLIDTTNVPMYFFVNQIGGVNPETGVFGQALSVSKMQAILLPGAGDPGDQGWIKTPFERFMLAAIFMFIFAVTIVVLAVMFLIRLAAFMVLLVFSSVGFVAFIVPGMEKYGKMWWDNFWKYALFGPAAMLMLLVASRFFEAMNDERAGIFASLTGVASKLATQPTFIAAMAMYAFPIVILWMAIGLGQKMGLAGAATISGKGEKFVKWMGKKTYDNPLGRGLGGGVKERAENNKFARVFTPKYWKGPSSVEAGIKGGIVGVGTAQGVRGGVRSELDKIHDKKVRDAVEEHKKNKTSHSQLVADLSSSDRVKSQSAAVALAQNDDIRSTAELTAGLTALRGNAEMTNEFVKKAQSAIQNVGDLATALDALGEDSKAASSLIDKVGAGSMNMTATQYRDMINSSLFQSNPNLKKDLNRRMKKEGQIQTIVDHEVTLPGGSYDVAYANLVADMSPDDLANQNDTLHSNQNFVNYVASHSGPDDTFGDEHRKNVFAKLSGQKKALWSRAGIHP